jgi:hypothetical protein
MVLTGYLRSLLNKTVYYYTQVPAKHVILFKFNGKFSDNENSDIRDKTTCDSGEIMTHHQRMKFCDS